MLGRCGDYGPLIMVLINCVLGFAASGEIFTASDIFGGLGLLPVNIDLLDIVVPCFLDIKVI